MAYNTCKINKNFEQSVVFTYYHPAANSQTKMIVQNNENQLKQLAEVWPKDMPVFPSLSD